MNVQRENFLMVRKLAVVTALMFAFGYALVPLYKAICEMTGINVLALGEQALKGVAPIACEHPSGYLTYDYD